MKKIWMMLGVILVLAGCGSTTKETVTVCSIDGSYNNYSSAKQTMTGTGDIAKRIDFEGILVAPDKETLDNALVEFDEIVDYYNEMEGITLSYERLDDITIKDMASYDLEKADFETLVMAGFLQMTDDEATTISIKQSIVELEAVGMTCK